MEATPTLGRIVHFVLGDGTVRPAIVTHVWSDTCINAHVFLDGTNDTDNPHRMEACAADGWATSVSFNVGTLVEKYRSGENAISVMEYPPRTWHWPPRV